jgi:hypothetical protein
MVSSSRFGSKEALRAYQIVVLEVDVEETRLVSASGHGEPRYSLTLTARSTVTQEVVSFKIGQERKPD